MLVHHITVVSFRLCRKNLGNLREFLGKWFTAFHGKKLPVRLWSNIREFIPFILEEEYKSIAKELLGKNVSIICDGTTRDGKALTMLIRYVHEWGSKCA